MNLYLWPQFLPFFSLEFQAYRNLVHPSMIFRLKFSVF